MINLTRFLLTVSVAILFFSRSPASAQEAAKPAAPAAAKINYQDHILPIFRAKCGTCHGVDQAKGGLVLDSYGAAILGGASGAVVEPGEADSSRLWALVAHIVLHVRRRPYQPESTAYSL